MMITTQARITWGSQILFLYLRNKQQQKDTTKKYNVLLSRSNCDALVNILCAFWYLILKRETEKETARERENQTSLVPVPAMNVITGLPRQLHRNKVATFQPLCGILYLSLKIYISGCQWTYSTCHHHSVARYMCCLEWDTIVSVRITPTPLLQGAHMRLMQHLTQLRF